MMDFKIYFAIVILAVSAATLPVSGTIGFSFGLLSRQIMAHQFTDSHNEVRKAFGLKPLVWDRNLAKYARRWANQRINDCALIHSPNSPYGENMFWSLRPHWTPNAVVKEWVDERPYYNPNTNECIDGQICGHYTQVIWKDTEKLGCARVQCTGGKGYLYVCSYDPPGNIYYEGPLGGTFSKSIVSPP